MDFANYKVCIAAVHLVFDNGDILDLLKKRGDAIAAEETSKKQQIEEQLENLKHNTYEDLIKPHFAYITFEDEEGYQRAIATSKDQASCFG